MREFEKFLWSFCLLSCSACESDWFATWPAFLPLILQCILIWFCSFPALLSDALRIAREFECNTLRVREDRQDVTIWGISAISNELLLLADSKNRAVKELHVPSGRVELVYSEHEPGWRVCNVRARCDAVGEFFVLLELNVNQTRLSVVRKRAGKYCDATHFALEKLSDLHVCSSFMIRILPLCSSMISSRCVVFLVYLITRYFWIHALLNKLLHAAYFAFLVIQHARFCIFIIKYFLYIYSQLIPITSRVGGGTPERSPPCKSEELLENSCFIFQRYILSEQS